jgi:hypothetical protein
LLALLLCLPACVRPEVSTPASTAPSPTDAGPPLRFSSDPRRSGSTYARHLAAGPAGLGAWGPDTLARAAGMCVDLLVRAGSMDCLACVDEDARVLGNARVVGQLREHGVGVALDTREDAAVLLRLGLPAAPGLWRVGTSGSVLGDLRGSLRSGEDALRMALDAPPSIRAAPSLDVPWKVALDEARRTPETDMLPAQVTLLLHGERELHARGDGDRAISVLRAVCRGARQDLSPAWLLALLDGLAWHPDDVLRACLSSSVEGTRQQLTTSIPCVPGQPARCLLFADAARTATAPSTLSAVDNALRVVALLDASEALGDVSARLLALGVLETWAARSLAGGVPHALDAQGQSLGRPTLADQAELVLALLHAHQHTGDPLHLQRAQRVVQSARALFCAAPRCEAALPLPFEPVPSPPAAGDAQARLVLALVRLSAVTGDPGPAGLAQRQLRDLWPDAPPWTAPGLALAAWELSVAPRFLWVMHQDQGKGAMALTDVALQQRTLGLVVRHSSDPGGGKTPRASVCRPQCTPPTADAQELATALRGGE